MANARHDEEITLFKYFPDETNGTPVKFTDTAGALAAHGHDPGDPAQYITIDWTSRVRKPGGGGCPQWIDYIVIGDALAHVVKARDQGLLSDKMGVASSSASSHDLQVIYVDADGDIKKAFVVKNALIPATADIPQPDQPVAAEVWFCDQPFDPVKTKILALEAKCNAGS